ncbi:hypothetical protein [Buchnera aphidicola]|uniref:hypothetical protein n=1 Tax=Buchnera aphidicola TaxID=9 RepID=UPI003CE584F9
MKATNKECYLAKYIRNEKSIWTGERTESIISIRSIINKLHIFQKSWTIISNIPEIIEFQNILNIQKKYFFFPEAQDIIPFTLLKIQEKKYSKYTDNNINYLYNFF